MGSRAQQNSEGDRATVEALVRALGLDDPDRYARYDQEGAAVGLGPTDSGLTSLPSQIGRLVRLRGLNLSGNRLMALPPEIGQLHHLEVLDLRRNQLTALPREIGQLSRLRRLLLSGNRLTALPPEIGHLSQLEELDLSGSPLAALPPEIGRLSQLQTLGLWGTRLGALPPEIGQLSGLRTLCITGSSLKALPPEISQLARLETLYLIANQLTTLPSEIGRLSRLRDLDLSDNPLTGLPPEMGQLSQLRRLALRDNPLITLPPEIDQLTQLRELDRGENDLAPVPPEAGELSPSLKGRSPLVYEIRLPEYTLEHDPNYLAVGTRLDRFVQTHFLGKRVAMRGICMRDHPDRSLDDLVSTILKIGTDKYDPDREGIWHEFYREFAGDRDYIHAGAYVVSNGLNVMAEFVEDMYASARSERGYPLRMDIITVYDLDQLEPVPGCFTFKHPNRKQEALLGIIKVLR